MKNKVFQLDACKFPVERQSHAEVQLSQSAAQRDLTLRWQDDPPTAQDPRQHAGHVLLLFILDFDSRQSQGGILILGSVT